MGKVNSKINHIKQKKKHHRQQHSTNSFSSSTLSTSTTSDTSSSSSQETSNFQSQNELFHYVDNRKYCKWNEYLNYVYPIDNDETDRGQTQHFMYKHVWDGNFSSPIKQELLSDTTKILDVGCGSGAWILDMASEYQHAHFTGVDCAQLYPTEIKPQNVSFVNANILLGLPFQDNTFDYIHMRFMLFAFTLKNWEIAVSELIRVCKPGGYIELVEKDILWFNEGPFCKAARTVMADELREKKDMEIIISPTLEKMLSQYSSNVNHEEKIVPLGEWGGKLGKLYRELYGWGAKNLKKVMKDIGFSEDEWNETVDICLKQLQERKGYDKIHRFWIQKK